jgi:hypothetical protein
MMQHFDDEFHSGDIDSDFDAQFLNKSLDTKLVVLDTSILPQKKSSREIDGSTGSRLWKRLKL